jgi:lipoate-protein ligase A
VSAGAVALAWTVLRDGALAGPENMARDEALARRVAEATEAGGNTLPAFLRFYAWARPTLSFGRNEPARDRFDPTALQAAGVDVVRRPTGGRAVLHHREVTYAVAVPARALGGPRDTYRRINEALARGLATLGAEVGLARDHPAAGLDAGPCFDLPAGGEVVARGRKLVGSAQARLGGALLQHGSILLHDDQMRIEGLAADAGRAEPGEALEARGSQDAPARPITLTELLGTDPGFERVCDAVESAYRTSLPGDWRRGANAAIFAPDTEFVDSEATRFGDREWTWRR